MMYLASDAIAMLWHGAMAAVPLVLIVAAVCRWCPCRPATRHTLWLCVLLWFGAAPALQRWGPPAVLPAWLAASDAPAKNTCR